MGPFPCVAASLRGRFPRHDPTKIGVQGARSAKKPLTDRTTAGRMELPSRKPKQKEKRARVFHKAVSL